MSRQFKTGEWAFLNHDITNPKGEVILVAGSEVRVMVYDPSKGETPLGIRLNDGSITQAYVAESSLSKNPARARETPSG